MITCLKMLTKKNRIMKIELTVAYLEGIVGVE